MLAGYGWDGCYTPCKTPLCRQPNCVSAGRGRDIPKAIFDNPLAELVVVLWVQCLAVCQGRADSHPGGSLLGCGGLEVCPGALAVNENRGVKGDDVVEGVGDGGGFGFGGGSHLRIL